MELFFFLEMMMWMLLGLLGLSAAEFAPAEHNAGIFDGDFEGLI